MTASDEEVVMMLANAREVTIRLLRILQEIQDYIDEKADEKE
jgi:hypothetical protein